MKHPLRWALFVVVSLTATGSMAQLTEKKKAPTYPLAEVRLGDGSLVRVTVLQQSLDVMTRYGKLTIPVAEIRRIDFGIHLPEGIDGKIDSAIHRLGSETYRERDAAVQELITLGSQAYPALLRATRSFDTEVAQRAEYVIKRIDDKVAVSQLRTKEEDLIQTAEFPVVGRIQGRSLRVYSAHFGELSLKLGDLRVLHVRAPNSDTEVSIDASRYGSATDQWMDSGIVIDSSHRLLISADGQVDLWPQGAGQYLVSPKGYTTAGREAAYMAGSLVGKVGENGKTFVVGEHYDGAPGEEGKLYLHIVPSPWNNASVGNYQVRVATEQAPMTEKQMNVDHEP